MSLLLFLAVEFKLFIYGHYRTLMGVYCRCFMIARWIVYLIDLYIRETESFFVCAYQWQLVTLRIGETELATNLSTTKLYQYLFLYKVQ